jgi:DNA topoisomerase-1
VERIEALRLPPAWKDVAVARSPNAKLQVVGRDKKGRWQYRYSAAAVREREKRKFDRLVAFGKALPRVRAAIARGLAMQGLPREKVMACILRILSTCFMRPGSHVYARENGSFGIATLQNRHAHVRGDTVTFDYIGKAGKHQVQELRDRRVARVVRQLKKVPGRELFQYVDEDGSVHNIRRRHINEYIKEAMGERFSAKDFRTWAGTMLAACALARLRSENVADAKKAVVAAVKETAAQLGNTPAVCKSSYIWPSVFRSFEQGEVLARNDEKSLLKLLRELPPARQRRPEPKLSRRMKRSPRMRRLAKAFRTLH